MVAVSSSTFPSFPAIKAFDEDRLSVRCIAAMALPLQLFRRLLKVAALHVCTRFA